jgi:GGDEF domain-containing protein
MATRVAREAAIVRAQATLERGRPWAVAAVPASPVEDVSTLARRVSEEAESAFVIPIPGDGALVVSREPVSVHRVADVITAADGFESGEAVASVLRRARGADGAREPAAVDLAPAELSVIDEIAARRGRSRTSLIQEALDSLIDARAGDARSGDAPPVRADDPVGNLARIEADSARVALGACALAAYLAEQADQASVALVDLDSSAEIRRLGIDAKIALVVEAYEVVSAAVAGSAWLIDSGTRDELYIITTYTGAAAVELAERVRARIAEHPFATAQATSVTASIGLAENVVGGSAFDAMRAARLALADAKVQKNCVKRFVEPTPERVVIAVSHEVVDAAEAEGRSRDSLAQEALLRLQERHTGIWHWAVTVAGLPERPR